MNDACTLYATLQRQNTEISKQIFPEKEYRGLSPSFHIHASVEKEYISGIFVAVQAVTERLVRNLMVKSGSEKRRFSLSIPHAFFYENEKEGRGYGSCARKSFVRNKRL